MGTEISILVLLVFMIVGALIAAETRSLLSSVISLGAVGVGVSIAFLFIAAPDLAIVQVSVEVLLLLFFIRATIGREVMPVKGQIRSPGLLPAILLCAAVLAFGVYALRSLPPFGVAGDLDRGGGALEPVPGAAASGRPGRRTSWRGSSSTIGAMTPWGRPPCSSPPSSVPWPSFAAGRNGGSRGGKKNEGNDGHRQDHRPLGEGLHLPLRLPHHDHGSPHAGRGFRRRRHHRRLLHPAHPRRRQGARPETASPPRGGGTRQLGGLLFLVVGLLGIGSGGSSSPTGSSSASPAGISDS